MNKRRLYGKTIGKTKIVAGLISQDGKIYDKVIANSAETANNIINITYELIDELIINNKIIKAIGIGATGVVDYQKGVIISSGSLPSWSQIPLAEIVRERYHLPVYVVNDVHASAIGEYYFGVSKGFETSTFLSIGTSIGIGTVINGRSFVGYNNCAGQIAKYKYGDHTIKQLASGRGISERITEIKSSNISTENFFSLLNDGDVYAQEVFFDAMKCISNAIKWITMIIDPGIIVLGGGVISRQPIYYESIINYINVNNSDLMQTPNIKKSLLCHDSVLVGAATLCLKNKRILYIK